MKKVVIFDWNKGRYVYFPHQGSSYWRVEWILRPSGRDLLSRQSEVGEKIWSSEMYKFNEFLADERAAINSQRIAWLSKRPLSDDPVHGRQHIYTYIYLHNIREPCPGSALHVVIECGTLSRHELKNYRNYSGWTVVRTNLGLRTCGFAGTVIAQPTLFFPELSWMVDMMVWLRHRDECMTDSLGGEEVEEDYYLKVY